MAAAISPLHRVTPDRLKALRSQRHGHVVVSQFGPDMISATAFIDGTHVHWDFSIVDESGRPLNLVRVAPRDLGDEYSRDWFVLAPENNQAGPDVPLVDYNDYDSLNAALSAALMLVVEIER